MIDRLDLMLGKHTMERAIGEEESRYKSILDSLTACLDRMAYYKKQLEEIEKMLEAK